MTPFPISPELTPDNYYMQFVPQVTAATQFSTGLEETTIDCAHCGFHDVTRRVTPVLPPPPPPDGGWRT